MSRSRRGKIDEFLAADQPGFSPLKKLVKQADEQRLWTDELRAVLPTELRRECRVTEVGQGQMTIVCRSAAAATRVRFDAERILEALSNLSTYGQVQRIKVRVSQNG